MDDKIDILIDAIEAFTLAVIAKDDSEDDGGPNEYAHK